MERKNKHVRRRWPHVLSTAMDILLGIDLVTTDAALGIDLVIMDAALGIDLITIDTAVGIDLHEISSVPMLTHSIGSPLLLPWSTRRTWNTSSCLEAMHRKSSLEDASTMRCSPASHCVYQKGRPPGSLWCTHLSHPLQLFAHQKWGA